MESLLNHQLFEIKNKIVDLLPRQLSNIKELLETNRMSHFPPFCDGFSSRNLTLKVGNLILRLFADQNYANEME